MHINESHVMEVRINGEWNVNNEYRITKKERNYFFNLKQYTFTFREQNKVVDVLDLFLALSSFSNYLGTNPSTLY